MLSSLDCKPCQTLSRHFVFCGADYEDPDCRPTEVLQRCTLALFRFIHASPSIARKTLPIFLSILARFLPAPPKTRKSRALARLFDRLRMLRAR